MKFVQLAYIMVLFFFFSGCNNSAEKMNVTDIMKDPEKQKEIFSIIVNDSSQMRQFRDYKKHYKNDMYVIQNCGYMINGDTSMCKMMMGEMMNMMEKDSIMCDVLCRHMKQHGHMKGVMNDGCKHMRNDEDCGMEPSGHEKK